MACAACFRGDIHEGTPKGEVGTVHGLNSYISRPPAGAQSRGIVVIIPDAFGWEFGNNRLLADTYAEKGGYTVYLPDFMNGHSAPLRMFDSSRVVMGNDSSYLSKAYHALWVIMDIVPFVYHCRIGATSAGVRGFFEQLRKDEGATQSIGAAGFCWGGKHVVQLAAGLEKDGKPLLDAGFTAHPSFLSIPGDLEKLKRPVSFALAAKDAQISPDQGAQIKKIVEALPAPATGESHIFAKTGHGFAVRADMNETDVAAQAAKAEDQAIAWFKKHFK